MRRLTVGSEALLVELDEDEDVAAVYAHITGLIASGLLPAARDVVPAARTVLVDGVVPERWWSALSAAGSIGETTADDTDAQLVRIPMRYDGADLAEIARQWGCGPEEVIERHLQTEFVVAFCGFVPGFAYCTSDPALPGVQRRADPRTRVPAGSVALAGPYCGIYPSSMPGGWQLLGATSEVMFDADRERPALLRPGDRVRFVVEPR